MPQSLPRFSQHIDALGIVAAKAPDRSGPRCIGAAAVKRQRPSVRVGSDGSRSARYPWLKQPEIKALTDRITTANKAETSYLTKRQTLPDPLRAPTQASPFHCSLWRSV